MEKKESVSVQLKGRYIKGNLDTIICHDCNGKGYEYATDYVSCISCGGKGVIKKYTLEEINLKQK